MIAQRMGTAFSVAVTAALLLACSSTTEPASGETDTAPAGDALALRAEVSRERDARRGCQCPRTPTCTEGCDPECVEQGRYLILGPVVLDMHEAGRLWQRVDAPRLLDHAAAVAYCTQLSRGCYASGWRLPSEPELRSLVYKAGGLQAGRPGYCDPAIDQAAFPSTASDHYWTADVDEARGEAKWVNFFDGREHTDVVTSEKHVRCVHDP
jgi:hypothetical protein